MALSLLVHSPGASLAHSSLGISLTHVPSGLGVGVPWQPCTGITMLRMVMVRLWSVTGKRWRTQEKAKADDCLLPGGSGCWGPRLAQKTPKTLFPSSYSHTPDYILVMAGNAGFLSSPNIPFTLTRHALHLIVYLKWGCKLFKWLIH